MVSLENKDVRPEVSGAEPPAEIKQKQAQQQRTKEIPSSCLGSASPGSSESWQPGFAGGPTNRTRAPDVFLH